MKHQWLSGWDKQHSPFHIWGAHLLYATAKSYQANHSALWVSWTWLSYKWPLYNFLMMFDSLFIIIFMRLIFLFVDLRWARIITYCSSFLIISSDSAFALIRSLTALCYLAWPNAFNFSLVVFNRSWFRLLIVIPLHSARLLSVASWSAGW